MSRARLIALAGRKSRLAAAAVVEREALAGRIARVDVIALRGLRVVEGIARVTAELRARPLLAVAAVAALAALRPRRALAWILKGWSMWRAYRGALRWWNGLMGGTPPRAG